MNRRLSLIETRKEIDLCTSFVYPPIPIRNYDWSAIDANTYEVSYEGEDETGSLYTVGGASGNGSTEQEAIDSLIDEILEAA